MKLICLLFLFAFVSVTFCEETGIKFSIEKEVIQDYQKIFMPEFIERIGHIKIPRPSLTNSSTFVHYTSEGKKC